MRLSCSFFPFISTIIFMMAFSDHCISQSTALVKGRVYDTQSQESLPGATILYNTGKGTISDSNGMYQFETEAGLYTVKVQYVGYKSMVKQVTLIAGEIFVLNIGLEPHITDIEQVVVSAGRVEQRISDLTVSVGIIKPQGISSSHTTDPRELMNKSSGIEVLDGQASIRGGSGFSYGAGSRVLMLIDGLPMLSADAGGIKWQSLPMENLSQIEIIKGASSVLYGSSALNGIINFRTAKPTTTGITSFYAETGVFDKPRQTNWIWWDSPRTFSSASFSHQKRYGNTDISLGSFVLYDNGYRRLNTDRLGRLNLKLSHQNRHVEGLTYGLSINGFYNQKQDFVLWENAQTGALKQNESTAQILHGSSIAIDPSIRFSKEERFVHDLRSRIMVTDNTFPEGGSNNSKTRSIYSEYQLGYKAASTINIIGGLVYYATHIRSIFYGDHDGQNTAAYAQADFHPFDRLKLTAGLRLEQNTLNGISNDIVPLFRAGVNYRILNLTFLRASFGEGYRYPSIAEKHAATTLGAVKIIPNPHIAPEKGWNTELGVKQGVDLGKYEGLIDLALFYSQNNDLIEYVFGFYHDPHTESWAFGFKANNIEHSRVYGLELEFMLRPKSNIINHSITGGYVYMYPVEYNPITHKNTNIHLKFRRKHAFNMNFSTTYKRIETGIHLHARSRILNIDDVFLNPSTRETILPGFFEYWTENNKGYYRMDISLAYRISESYKFSLALKNATNTEYMGRPGDIQAHRHVSLRISGTF